MKVFYVRPDFSKELSISLRFSDISVLYTALLRVLLLLAYLLFFYPPFQIKSLQSLESSLLRGYHQVQGSGEREREKRGRNNKRHRKKMSESCPLIAQQSQCRTIRGHHRDTELRPGAEHTEKRKINYL